MDMNYLVLNNTTEQTDSQKNQLEIAPDCLNQSKNTIFSKYRLIPLPNAL